MSLIQKFIASEKEKLKGYSFTDIREYICEYYKGVIIGFVVFLVVLISILTTVLGTKDAAINGVLLNCYQFGEDQSSLFDDYPEYAGLDPDAYEFGFNTSQYLLGDDSANDIYTMQALMVGVGAGDTDFITADWTSMEALCYQAQFFVDLRTVLPEETLEKLSDRLYYADNSILVQIKESEQWIEGLQIPDPKHPETMKEPFPVAIDLQGCEKLSELYLIQDAGTCFSFVCTSKNRENTITFLNYLLES